MYYEIFEKLCQIKGVRPADVSRATGISTATLTSWKKGKYTPKNDKLQKIADYFGVTLDYLMSGESSTIVHPDGQDGWYLDPETARLAQEAFDNPNLRLLMDSSRDLSPQDLKILIGMAERMKGDNY